MSVNEVLARVGKLGSNGTRPHARASTRAAAVATARTGQVPDASFQATLENVQNQALAGTVPVAPTSPLVSIRAPGTSHTTLTWGQRWRLRPSNTSGRPTWPEETVLRQGGIARR